jgi:hypothetical protein
MKKQLVLISLALMSSTVFAKGGNLQVGENLILKSSVNSHSNVSVIALNKDDTVDVINNDEPNWKYSILKGINPSNLSKPIKSIKGISAGDRVVVYSGGHWEATVMAVYTDETADIYYSAQNYTYKSVNISTLRHPITSLDGISVGAEVKMKFSDGTIDDVKVLAVYEDKTADVLYLKNNYIYEDIGLKFITTKN